MTRKLLIYLAVMVGIVLFSGLFIYIFGNSIQVSCLRGPGQNPTCRITTILLGRYPMSNRLVTEVAGVQMEEDCDDGCSYRAVLVNSDGQAYPVNEVYTDEGIPRRQVEALQGFLFDPEQPSLEYTEPVQWWVVALIGGMDLVGILAIAGNFLASVRNASS